MTSLPGGDAAVSESQRAEKRREKYHFVPIHSHESLATPGPFYSENQFSYSMPYPPFSNLNQILPSFTQPPTPAPPVPRPM